MKLWRPVGFKELSLIFDSGMKEYPPRLSDQPVFYPVLNRQYATEIARDWNTRENTGAGFITAFSLPDSFKTKYEVHVVGNSTYEEWWVPAPELPALNLAIEGFIVVEAGFFSESFVGEIPETAGLQGKNAREQFASLAAHLDYSSFDVWCETNVNRKAIYMNYLYWRQCVPSVLGVSEIQKDKLLGFIEKRWASSDIGFPLPGTDFN